MKRLAELEPNTIITGHGPPIAGMKASEALKQLAREFETLAIPEQGRYVPEPVMADRDGTPHLPGRAVAVRR